MEKEKKPIYKKWWFWLIIIIIIMMVATSGEENSNTTITSNSNAITEQKATEKEQEKKVKVGDIVTTDNEKITFKSSSEYKGYSAYAKPASGNKVIKAQFDFENISDGDIFLNNMDCYADGEKCETYYASDYKSPAVVTLSKGKKFKATVYFEVPKSAKEIIIEYETDYWSSEKVEFVVK